MVAISLNNMLVSFLISLFIKLKVTKLNLKVEGAPKVKATLNYQTLNFQTNLI